jgi:hypothetical protein
MHLLAIGSTINHNGVPMKVESVVTIKHQPMVQVRTSHNTTMLLSHKQVEKSLNRG